MKLQKTKNFAARNLKGATEAAALRAAGKLEEAEAAYRQLTAAGGEPAAFSELCLVLSDLGRNEEALGVVEQALARYPDHLQLIAQRGVILERLRRYAEAIAVYEQVLLRDRTLAPVLNNLAGLLNLQGRYDEAVDLFRRSLAIESSPANHSNLLLAMNYSGRYDQSALFAEHKRWAAQHAPMRANVEPFTNQRDPDRRLRVGYVSADFKMHPVAFFIGAVIANHNRNAVEIFCYSSAFASDEMTSTLRRMNVVWRDIAALDDAGAAQLIHDDGIDLIVDLAGHTAGNRLLALARRPAPIQATYLGYPNTTGMQAISYRFTDAWADPPGISDDTHSETLIRLPDGFLAYTPPENMPMVGELPARTNGRITFGSFNNLAKISRETVALWSRVLAEVANSRLMIKAQHFVDAGTRERFYNRFLEYGVAGDRLLLLSEPRGAVDHYDTLNSVDIALDTAPYNGTTTTCEALWMGVPVLVLAGDRHASRVGVSLLNTVGLPELIAPTPEAYVALARGLASDLGRLSVLRGSLRSRLAGSVLLDAGRLTRALETSYRTLWRNWCANGDSGEHDRKSIRALESPVNDGESNPRQAYRVALENYTAGRFDQAQAGITEVLSRHPRHVNSLCLLGAINIRKGSYQRAVDVLRRAISLNPKDSAAHSSLGVALRALGKLEEAVASFQQAVVLKPDVGDAHVNLGAAFKDMGRFDDAIKCYRRAIELEPDNAKSYSNLGIVLAEQGHLDEAAEAYHRALALKPDYAEAHNNLGAVFDKLGRLREAEESFRGAISSKPDYAQAHCNLGLTLKKMDRFIEAEQSFRKALTINPVQAEAHHVLGIVQKFLGRLDEGTESFRRAISIKPDYADAHFSLANAQLALGDFEKGWRGYEWRLRTDWYGPRNFTQPLWKGEDLTGKTILLYPEQGFGDVILFLRYAPLMAARSGRVIVEVPLPLARLAATLKGRGQVIATGDPPPAFDVYCSLLSLPERFRTTLATIPARVPYLSADPALVEKWRQEIASDRGLKVGLAWAGNPKNENDRYRSIGLDTLRLLVEVSGIHWFSLQVGEPAAEVARLSSDTITDLSDRLTDFAETAAVIANLDLVITIDSAVAHLAGALGRPVWTLVPAIADWRYLPKEGRSAWYPTMRVFRQASLGEWDSVISRVHTELAKLTLPHLPSKKKTGLNDAIALHQGGQLAEAEQLYRNILKATPDHFDARHLLGVLMHQQGRNPEALEFIGAALQTRPYEVVALSNYGAVFSELKRFHEALASYDKAIALKPDYAEAHFNRGVALQELKRFDEALASYDRALSVRPDYAEALCNRGNALMALKRLDDALASYDRAIALKPDYAEALSNRGNLLKELKRFDEALASYDRALSVQPDYAEAHFNEALCRLFVGDFDRGWKKHEWRWGTKQLGDIKRRITQPLWLGQENISGKTILLHAEQGFGDTIQFCRYVPLVAERGARVILEVQKPLRELMSTLTGAVQIVSRGDPLPDFDIHSPLLSLPLAFGTRLETIPGKTPYLYASSQALKSWATRLGPKRGPRIGLAWSGNPSHKNDSNRSISLRALLPLLGIDATFVSLQKDVHPDDAALLKKRKDLLHVGEELKDFSDTAALISHLDLVISVDTSVAHLAGALGKPVWLLLPFVPDWRWLLDREDSPWYPTARMFRQDDTRAWDSVIMRVHGALLEFAVNQNGKQRVNLPDVREHLNLPQMVKQAVALHQKGEMAEAEGLYLQILRARPDHFDAQHLLGALRHQQGRHAEALELIDAALKSNPNVSQVLSSYGTVLSSLKRYDEAIAAYDKALRLKPDDAEVHYCRATTLNKLKRYEEALVSYDKALAIRPRYAEALYNRGNALQGLKRLDDALASYDNALMVRPDYAEAHWNGALAKLLIGDFERGWPKYEWRWKNESLALPKRNFSQPLWLGADAIDGKTVLLHSEQGFGDTIQFCRYVPLVAARGARVILEVERPLQELVSSLAGAAQVISKGDPLPHFDLQCPLLTLPLAFVTRLDTIPSATPYLHKPVQAMKDWQARLGPKARPRIGLAWSGKPTHKNDQNRSISLRSLLPLLDIEATFVSLQKDVRADDAAVLKERKDILHFGDSLKDFCDTAALISQLDLVISVDTSVAHLAGALAWPVWVLLPFVPDWRWLLEREDSPWYPTARLFRQDDTRAWDNVIMRVSESLFKFVKG